MLYRLSSVGVKRYLPLLTPPLNQTDERGDLQPYGGSVLPFLKIANIFIFLCLLLSLKGEVFAQAGLVETTVSVHVNNWQAGNDTPIQKDITVQEFSPKILITEWLYNPANNADYPFGEAIEVTTTDFTGTISTSAIYLQIGCSGSPIEPFPLSDWLGVFDLLPSSVYTVALPPNLSTSCAISSYIKIFTIPLSLTYTISRNESGSSYTQVISASPVALANDSDTYKLTDRGWELTPSANSLGYLNDNLTQPCFFQALRFNNGVFNFLTYPMDYAFINGDLFSHNNKPFHQLPGYKLCISSGNDWDNFPFDWSFYTTSSSANTLRRNVLTVHFAFEQSIKYLIEVLGFTVPASNFPKSIRYSPVGDWTSSDNSGNILNEGATLSVVGHEIGHNINTSFSLGSGNNWGTIDYFNEGFADIWATLIECYAFGLAKPDYAIKSTISLTNGVPPRDSKKTAAFGSDHFNNPGKYNKSMPLSHWFYLLSEGVNETVGILAPSSNRIALYKYVCGLGHENTTELVYNVLQNRIAGWAPSGSVEDRYTTMRNFTLDEAASMGLSQAQQAQIKNAWAAVNVGDPDFYVTPTPTATFGSTVGGVIPVTEKWEVCTGSNFTLTTGSSLNAADNTWWEFNGNTLPSEYTITGANAGHAGIYTAFIEYDINGQVCTLQREIELIVKDLVINPVSSTILCYNQPLVLSYSAHSSVSNTFWTDPNGNTLTAFTNPDGLLTIPNPISGNYTIWGTCQGAPIADQIYIAVIDMPTITITPSAPNAEFCLNDTFTLTIEEDYYSSYAWAENGIAISAANILSGIASQPGTTTYSVTVTDTNGCTATATTTVTVFEPPQTAIEPQAGTENCTAMLTAATTNGTAPYSYTWLPLEQTTQQITAYSPGSYSVTVTDANGCTTAAAYDLPVTDLLPTPHLAGFYTVGTSPMPAGATTDPTAPNTEIWNTLNLKVAGAIIVPTGYILRIENSSIEMIGGENAEIIVKPGGKLHLSTATLYAGNCYNSFWKGISVEGSDVPYSTTDFAVAAASGNYGVLVSENDTKINHARIGACNGRITATGINQTGGLLSITHTEFKDNGTAIRIEKFNASGYQFPFIQNAAITFTQNTPPNNAPENWWHYALGQPVGIWISKTRLLEPIHNNLFASSLSVQAAGVGIRIEDAAATISALPEPPLWTDPFATPQIYEFTGLFKGIDVYNTLTIMKEVNITNLNFQTTQKSITLNGAVGSKISYNTFTVPYGASISADTYGLLSFGSIGSIIERNKFWSEQNAPSPYTFGAILNKTEYGEVPTTLTNNLFDGRFMPATQFIDANGYLSTNCNAYDDCDIDWHLAPTATLPQQGICASNADLALRTHWHYTNELGSTIGYPNYHIINDNTAFTLTLNIDNSEQSDPLNGTNYVIGNVYVQECGTPASPVYNMSCAVSFPQYDMGMADCNNEGDIERRIYNFLRNSQRDSLLALLHCLDTDWAIRLLVGTYVDERLYEQALAELQRLPNTPENAEFIALYQAIINGGLTEPEGSGKANAALSTISSIAYNSNSSLNKLAESILAVYKNYEYVRHGQPVLLKPQSPKKDKSIFYIMPNPATTSVVCKLWQPLEQHSRLLVSDFSGRIVMSVFVPSASLQVALDISQLNNGIYFCRLDGTGSVQKLVVVK